MSEALQRIDDAVRELVKAGCHRDPASGCWFDKAGLALSSDPMKSWRLLRRETIRTAIEKKRMAGETCYR